MVDLALSSLALLVYARTQQYPPAARDAMLRYGSLLRLARDRVAQLNGCALDNRDVDACLIAIALMARFESSRLRPGDHELRADFNSLHMWSHDDGACEVLKIWKARARGSAVSPTVKHTRRGLIRAFLLRSCPVPQWMLDGRLFGEQGRDLDWDRIFVRITHLHYELARLEQTGFTQAGKAEKIYDEVQDLDEALQFWAAQLPKSKSYQRHLITELSLLPTDHIYSSTVYGFSSAEDVVLWMQYFTTRIITSSMRLRALDLEQLHSHDPVFCDIERRNRITDLQTMAESLACAIPFCLERFVVMNSDMPAQQASINLSTSDRINPYLANMAVWPLTIASSAEGVNDVLQQWFRAELGRLGKITGDGILECAETGPWPVT